MQDISAAEFKRRFMNKAKQTAARQGTNVRQAVGAGSTLATPADKNRLRSQWTNRDGNPGKYYNPANAKPGAVILTVSQS